MTVPSSTEITSDDKLWALLSFIFPLVGLILLFIDDKKGRPFIKYNAIQSVMLGVVSIVLSFVCIGVLVWIYGIYLGVQAYGGQWVTIPVLTDFGKKQGWL